MNRIVLTTIRVAAFVLTVALWRWLLGRTVGPLVNLLCVVGTVLAILPVVWFGRRLLEGDPTKNRVAWVTTFMHAVLMVLFGTAIVKAIQTGDTWQGAVVPVPRSLGLVLAYATGVVTLLTVANLALRGLGAPFDIVLSRRPAAIGRLPGLLVLSAREMRFSPCILDSFGRSESPAPAPHRA